MGESEHRPQGADPPPLLLRVAMAGGNHLNEEITPLLPTGIGERAKTILNLGYAAQATVPRARSRRR
jgi:hypothetical protein